MEFRLLYSGRLLGASRDDSRAGIKHDLRRQFHPQLRRLWQTNHGLIQLSRYLPYVDFGEWAAKHPDVDLRNLSIAERSQIGIEAISRKWQRGDFYLVPLVTSELALRCRIEILFLRPEERRYVMKSGDLDSRLKTVFDALRIPANLSETGGIGPQEDETPFFCLLEDDKLISEVSVNADQLLCLPKERGIDPNDSFLVVHVRLNHAQPGTFDQFFS